MGRQKDFRGESINDVSAHIKISSKLNFINWASEELQIIVHCVNIHFNDNFCDAMWAHVSHAASHNSQMKKLFSFAANSQIRFYKLFITSTLKRHWNKSYIESSLQLSNLQKKLKRCINVHKKNLLDVQHQIESSFCTESFNKIATPWHF